MQLIDSHTHLDFPDFDADRLPLLARSRALGVEQMVVLGLSRIPGSGCGIWCKQTVSYMPPWVCTRCTSTGIDPSM